MRPAAVAVLPRQASAGNRLPLALAVNAGVPAGGGARRSIAAAVCVHPSQKVRVPPPLVKAMVAGDGTAPTPHFDDGVALRLMTCHRKRRLPGLLRNDLLLKRS